MDIQSWKFEACIPLVSSIYQERITYVFTLVYEALASPSRAGTSSSTKDQVKWINRLLFSFLDSELFVPDFGLADGPISLPRFSLNHPQAILEPERRAFASKAQWEGLLLFPSAAWPWLILTPSILKPEELNFLSPKPLLADRVILFNNQPKELLNI